MEKSQPAFGDIHLVLLPGGIVTAQTSGSQFFSETGHWVSNAFLEKYNSVPNPRDLFGFPITDQFRDETSGLTLQYFQKARFQLHPQAPPDLRVQLSPLGEFLYESGKKVEIPSTFPSCRQFPQTGYQVCYAFLAFFESNGGISQFGYPISGLESHDGWFVQYFQRARFEWHPERSPGEKVMLSNLGTSFFQFNNENPSLLKPKLNDNLPIQPVSNLHVYAFVEKPISSVRGNQALYVIVYDQNYHPVEDAFASFIINLPNGESIEGKMDETDSRGISSIQFPIVSDKAGTAEITVTITLGALQKITQTSFQLW